MGDTPNLELRTIEETRVNRSVSLPYDELLTFAKRLCAERGVELPDGDWRLWVEPNGLGSRDDAPRAGLLYATRDERKM